MDINELESSYFQDEDDCEHPDDAEEEEEEDAPKKKIKLEANNGKANNLKKK